MGNDVNQKRLAAERNHRVNIGFHFVQGALNGRSFGDMAQMARYTEIIGISEILFSEELFQHSQRAALMRHHFWRFIITLQGDNLDG